MHRIALAAVLLVSSLSAVTLAAEPAQRPAEKKVVGEKSRLVETKPIQKSFALRKRVLEPVTERATLTLHEGLPRFRVEEPGPKTTRYGYDFFATPRRVSKQDALRLRQILTSRSALERFGGFKLCGGFNPDFALQWRNGKEDVEVHICLTCHEVRAYRGKLEFYCDISDDAYEPLKKVLAPYRQAKRQP